MSRLSNQVGVLLVASTLFLAACGNSNGNKTPTPDAASVYTQAAATVQADLTQVAVLTPSATATTPPTDTPQATATPPTPLPSSTPQPSATTTAIADQASFVSETIPDNTTVTAGQTLTKTWRLKNVGTTTWSTAYSLVFYSGNQMSGPNSVNLPKTVVPGDEVDVTVSLTAPSSAGTYVGNWVLRNADGINFYPVYIKIVVTDAPTATLTNTPAPTSAPTATATTGAPSDTPAPTAVPTT